MKTFKYILLGLSLTLGVACQPDLYEIVDNDFASDKVKYVETKSSTNILYANNLNEFEAAFNYFDIITYTVKDFEITEEGDSVLVTSEQTDTVRLKVDKVPAERVSYYDGNNNKLDFPLQAGSGSEGILEVYAKVGDVLSEDPLLVQVVEERAAYEEVIMPVVFHMIESEGYDMIEITKEDIDKVVNRLNVVYNNPSYRGANSGNANVKFMLAQYTPDGQVMTEAGINRTRSNYNGSDLAPKLVTSAEFTEWSPAHYLNIWVCTALPNTMLPEDVLTSVGEENWLRGLPNLVEYNTIEEVIQAEKVAEDPMPGRLGVIVGATYTSYTDVYNYVFNSFAWEKEVGTYLGLINTSYSRTSDLVDGDIDYCADTYSYHAAYGTMLEKKSVEGHYYDSENVMDNLTTNKVISADQVERIRWVLESCPSRQAWKSEFAFNGTK